MKLLHKLGFSFHEPIIVILVISAVAMAIISLIEKAH